MSSRTITKRIKLPQALNARLSRRAAKEKKGFSAVLQDAVIRGLEESDGIDMAAALEPIIGKYAGSGDSQALRLRRYGRARHR
jgi:hypothetical protein